MHRFTNKPMHNQLISIGKVAQLLGVSIDTLRRWDKVGRLPSDRSGLKGHRFYSQTAIDQYLQDIKIIARNWAQSTHPSEPNPDVYCQTRDVFQARLETLQSKLSKIISINMVSLIIAVAGEIGNNSFDHNLGSWPDIPGVFFEYSLRNRKIVLADRGQGVLNTLKRVRSELTSSGDAIKVAFTENISGRYPESRGNGLKFVRSIIINNSLSLYFQTEDSQLYLKMRDQQLDIKPAKNFIQGCFATISFEESI